MRDEGGERVEEMSGKNATGLGASPRRRFEGSAALFLVAACGTYGAIIVSILPSLVGAWITENGLTEQAAGDIAAVNVLAATIGLCLSLFLVSRWPLPRIARFGLLLAIAGDGASILADGWLVLSACRGLEGLGIGLLVGAVTNWIGRHEHAARGFGMYIMLQFVFAAAYIAAVPYAAPLVGGASVYAVLLVFAFISLLLAPLLGLNGGGAPLPAALASSPEYSAAAETDHPVFLKLLAVLGFGFFNVAAVGLWSYMLRYGELVGLSPEAAAQTLAFSALCGIPGTLLVILLGSRYGRAWPLVIALAVYTAPALLFALSEVSASVFIAGIVVQNVAWAIVAPYFQAVQAALDRTGRLAVWGMIMVSVGAGLGPALIGFSIDGNSYVAAFAVAIAFLAVAAFSGFAPALVADAHENPNSASAGVDA